jgi:CotS family spore coat protein
MGFKTTERFYTGADGLPYALWDGGAYVMTDLLRCKEFDFICPVDFEKVLITVARMHSLMQGIEFDCDVFYGETNIFEQAEKQIMFLKGIKKRIGKRLSDFDVLFIKNCDYYIGEASAAAELLLRGGFERYMSAARLDKTICHNSLKEENILFNTNNTVYIADFSQMCVAPALLDISELIRRHGKKSGEPVSISRAVEIYSRHHALAEGGEEIVRALLRYPRKFIKVCEQYYSKKRSWTPSAIINCLRVIIDGREAYERYLNDQGPQ